MCFRPARFFFTSAGPGECLNRILGYSDEGAEKEERTDHDRHLTLPRRLASLTPGPAV